MTIARISLPNEFYDRTSAMMLAQPIPQFLFARALFAASMQAEFAQNPDMFDTWRKMSAQGAPVLSLESQQLVLADPSAELFAITNEVSAGPGQTIRINRPVFSGGGYTEASRTIAANQTISTTAIDITQEQVSLTIKRVAGPYDTTNSRVAPRAIDAEDAKRSVHNLVQMVGVDLQYDRMAYLDTTLAVKFTTGATTIFPNNADGTITTDAAAFVINGDRSFNMSTVFAMLKSARTSNLPTFSNGRYKLFVNPAVAENLANDPAWQRAGQLIVERNVLSDGYLKTVQNCDVYVCNTLPVDTSTVSGVTINKSVLCAPKAVGYASGTPCHVEPADDTNYGQTFRVIWVAVEAQAVLDNRFLVVAHSD